MMNKKLVEQLYKDRNAVREILNQYEEDWEEVDDMMQDVFMHVSEADFDGESSPLTFICAVAKNVGKMHVRAKSRDKRKHEVAAGYIENVQDEDGYNVAYYDRVDLSDGLLDQCATLDPARELEANETYSKLIKSLPPRQAEAVELRYQGHSNPEIAEKLGTTVSYVENLISSARKFALECENSEVTATNSVRERDAKPYLGERFATQADIERTKQERFEMRCKAIEKRWIRQLHPLCTVAQWKEMYS